jgi:hypothetical protein
VSQQLAETYPCGHPRTAENSRLAGPGNACCKLCNKRPIRNSRYLSRAYKKLGITALEVDSAPRATPFLKRIGGISRAIETLQTSPVSEARAFVAQYQRTDISGEARRLLSFEAYCVAAKVCPSRVLEIVVGAMAKQRVLEGAVIAALAHPTIMRQNTRQAALPDGLEDRMAHLKMVGAMPLPKTSQTVVNVNAQANAVAASKADTAILPAPEDTIRRMVEARQRQAAMSSGIKELPATVTEVIPAFMPRRESVVVEAEYESEESDD